MKRRNWTNWVPQTTLQFLLSGEGRKSGTRKADMKIVKKVQAGTLQSSDLMVFWSRPTPSR